MPERLGTPALGNEDEEFGASLSGLVVGKQERLPGVIWGLGLYGFARARYHTLGGSNNGNALSPKFAGQKSNTKIWSSPPLSLHVIFP